jgi:hypothetical protein
MSQQIAVRGSASIRRGASLVAIVIAILVIGAAAYGGLYWYSNRPAGKDAAGPTTDESATVKSYVGDLEASLQTIAKDPTKADEEVEAITKLANEDFSGLQEQVSKAPADVKLKIVAMIKEQLPKLKEAIEAAYKIPGVKEKLEPLVSKIMTGLATLGV